VKVQVASEIARPEVLKDVDKDRTVPDLLVPNDRVYTENVSVPCYDPGVCQTLVILVLPLGAFTQGMI